MRLTAEEKLEIIRLVEQSDLGVRQTLNELGIHRSTFYNWYNRYREKGPDGLSPKRRGNKHFWNKIPEEIKREVLNLALEEPELSSREVACRYTDKHAYFISESSVYRLLKKMGLISSPPFDLVKAADYFENPTTRINELWQSDFTYLKVVSWGWYYLSTILDDYSRFIIAWELCTTMKTVDVKTTLHKAFNQPYVNLDTMPKFLSDNGSCYISKELGLFMDELEVKHIRGRPNHPQTQGKIERYHRTMKNRIKLENYYSPYELRNRIEEFVQYYNYERYHESLDNLTPADVYFGNREKRLRERLTIKKRTLKNRKLNYLRKSLQSAS